jgi:hypothetical protein
MDRYRQMTNKEKLRAHALRREGLAYETIAETLSGEAEDGRKFDRATIYRVCKNMPDSPLDEPFRWHKLEEYGIPWEASGFIMDMLNEVHKFRGFVIKYKNELPFIVPARLIPTFREVIWWWRVHQATPEIPQQVGYLGDISELSNSFVVREMAHELLKLPLETADLEACLALKPWLNEERHSDYHEMVELGVVPPVNVEMEDMTSAIRRDLFLKAGEKMPVLSLPPRTSHPELLFSQQFKMYEEAMTSTEGEES